MDSRHRKERPLAEKIVSEAASGEEPAVHRLLTVFSETVQAGGTPDRQLLDYIAQAFDRVLCGDRVRGGRALGVFQSRQGRPPKSGLLRGARSNAGRDQKLARAVDELLTQGTKLINAYVDVAKRLGVSSTTVRRAWREWETSVQTERLLRTQVSRLLAPLIRDQQTGRAVSPITPEVRNDLRPIVRLLQSYLKDLERAIRLWHVWRDGLITEALHARARRSALEFGKMFGIVSALEGADRSPEDGWRQAMEDPNFVNVLKILTSPPDGCTLVLANESEIREAWLRGFRPVREILQRG